MALLEVRDLAAGYGEMEVLYGVSVQLEKGEIVAVLGPNGAGKSTLIKAIFGLLKPTRGVVRFQDRDITGLAPETIVTLGLAYVPQTANVFPSLTVRENLEMGGFLLRRPLRQRLASGNGGLFARLLDHKAKRDIEARIEEVLGLFPDLRGRLRDRTGNLSGGQQQMVALAKSLILQPAALLIDEPSAGLAPKLVDLVFRKIRDIRERGTSILLVEQRARRALELADRGYILDMGRNRYEDRGEALLRNPEVGHLYLGG